MHDFETVLPALRAARCLAEHTGRAAPAAVAVSLLHHIRAHGADPDAEARTHRLARSIDLTYITRHTAAREIPHDGNHQ